MKKIIQNISSDLQGVSQITVDAVKGVTSLVESLHSTIASFTSVVGDPKKDAQGISGMVYRNIRKITDIFGDGLDVVLGKLSQSLDQEPSLKSRHALIAVTNGVIGDYLHQRNNPLAIAMSLRQNHQSLNDEAIDSLLKKPKQKVLILVHGLCMNDLHWQKNGDDYGQMLAQDLGYVPLYLHYNTGRHVSENGKELAKLLQRFSQKDIRISFLAHSMGGLVVRSAFYYAQKLKYDWLHQCQSLIFLGTPHHGALLEKGGNWLNTLLKISPYTEPFSKITSIRSSGITDLRFGNVIERDWLADDRFAHNSDRRTLVALPKKVKCYAIAATTGQKENSKFNDNIIGDGLVTVDSALGRHKTMDLHIPQQNQWLGRNINHNQLLHNSQVYAQIKQWLK